MRRAAHVDRNQREIVEALRKVGATVQHLHAVGKGCPDLVAGFRGQNYFLEVKPAWDRDKRLMELNEREEHWHLTWRGQVAVVRTPEEALLAIGARVSGVSPA